MSACARLGAVGWVGECATNSYPLHPLASYLGVFGAYSSMAHFYIAGDAQSVSFARGERLCDQCHALLPHFQFTKLISPTENWRNVSADINQKWGFQLGENRCVVWNANGRLLGNDLEWEKYVHETYNIDIDVSSKQLLDIADENEAAVRSMLAEMEMTEEEPNHIVVNSWEKSAYN